MADTSVTIGTGIATPGSLSMIPGIRIFRAPGPPVWSDGRIKGSVS